jgi:hypothetical protein
LAVEEAGTGIAGCRTNGAIGHPVAAPSTDEKKLRRRICPLSRRS